jgi:hypothetical protein
MMAVSKSVTTQVIAEATSPMRSICRPVIDHVPGYVCYFIISLASSAATDGASNSSKRDFSAIAKAPTRKSASESAANRVRKEPPQRELGETAERVGEPSDG